MSLRERLTQVGESGETAAAAPAAAKDEIKRDLHKRLVEELSNELDAEGSDDDRASAQDRGEAATRCSTRRPPRCRRPIAARSWLTSSTTCSATGRSRSSSTTRPSPRSWSTSSSSVYIERAGRIYFTEARFLDEAHLRRIIDKIVGQVGRRVDEASPMVDARLPDGSRVNAVVHPLAINGPMLTIRKFSHDPYQIDDLISFGTLNERTAQLLDACVRGRMNILISGGTGTGKTTLLNVVSQFIPGDERIVTIEDSAELAAPPGRTCSASSRGPPTSRARGRSPSATSCATRCACGPTASSSARCVAARRSTCCRR